MQSVSQITEEILDREGGYVDDPDDPGGATNHGVTIHTMRRLGLDLNGDEIVTKADVRALSRDEAGALFEDEYYTRPGIGRLPEAIQPSVYDMHVHAGRQAFILLQSLLNDLGEVLVEDGILGPRSFAAAHRVHDRIGGEVLRDAYGIERRRYYYRLADARPASRKYVRRRDGGKGGWITRAEAFLSPPWHLSPAAHARRIASWG
ncbi:lysozyme family protein [Rubricella aquisinus]|uniref:Lysozyme family protein n=1 Tax=Rubricella aquisinus TaxID=2028108 RepID=A0A840WYW3_9RHOB|nr:holin-associated N-acetylmuramidase [Rubricella aquisinus]MBB5514865.1 lysozyme family protein [Rubricella aquisinus]